jgi:hypothetical protein
MVSSQVIDARAVRYVFTHNNWADQTYTERTAIWVHQLVET